MCVCVCTRAPLMKMYTQVASLILLTRVLGQGCLKFEKAVCDEGTGKDSKRNTHTLKHTIATMELQLQREALVPKCS